MKEINSFEISSVSGGNLSTIIMDFLNPSRVPPEKGEWESGSTIETPAYGKGDDFGKLFFGVLAAAAVTTIVAAAGIFGGLFASGNRSSK